MRSWVAGFGFLLVGLLAACGGKTVTTSEGGDDPEEIADPDSKNSQEADQQNDEDFPADTELGECKLGEMRWDVASGCAWIAENRCYETREMACNCACPRDHNSQCTSGFDAGPEGRIQVECY